MPAHYSIVKYIPDPVSDEQIKKFYDENGQQFERPETVRAAHILLSTRDPSTNQELNEEKKKEKTKGNSLTCKLHNAKASANP